MTVKQSTVGLIVIAAFAVFIFTSQALGLWSTESSKEPITFTSGEFAGEYNPGDIRGSYTFADVENAFQVPVETLVEAFAVPDTYNGPTFMNKELEELYSLEGDAEIGNGSVKLFVALYTGLPYDYASSGDYLLKPAVDILVSEGVLDDDQLTYLNTHTIELSSLQPPSETEDAEEAEMEVTEETLPLQIKGKTLFKELLDGGLTKDEIEGVLGMEMGTSLMEVRTYCSENGLDFSTVKADLQAIIDSKSK